MHTFPFSYQNLACWRERTLQSKIALFERALSRATARPILICSLSGMQRSWNGWEFGLHENIQHGNVISVVVDKSNDWFDNEGDKLPFVFGGEVDISSVIFKTKSLG